MAIMKAKDFIEDMVNKINASLNEMDNDELRQQFLDSLSDSWFNIKYQSEDKDE